MDFKEEQAFTKLKHVLTTGPILIILDLQKPFLVTADASGDCIGAALIQEGHVVAFESRRLKDAELRYDVYKKELLAVVHALKIWKHYLLGVDFLVKIDHQSLQYFMKQPVIREKHMVWSNFMQAFHFQIEYTLGKDNVVADALSRQPRVNHLSVTYHDELTTLKEYHADDPNFSQV